MRHSCCHCQRIDFVEPTQASMVNPGWKGPQRSVLDPNIEVQAPSEGGGSILWQWQQECRISIQVLLDDGNRIIIAQGNFKIRLIILLGIPATHEAQKQLFLHFSVN